MLKLFMDVGGNERFILRLAAVFGEEVGEHVASSKVLQTIRHAPRFPTPNIKACTPSKSEVSNPPGPAQPLREPHE